MSRAQQFANFAKRHRFIFWSGCAGFALLGGIFFGWRHLETANLPNAETILYRHILNDASGQAHDLRAYRGKILVVNFWATWCAPCVEEIPEFSRLQTRLQGQNVQFVGIGVDQADNIAVFQKKNPASYPLLVGDYAATDLARQLGNASEGLPYTVIFDRQGQVVARKAGRLKEAELMAWLQALLPSQGIDGNLK